MELPVPVCNLPSSKSVDSTLLSSLWNLISFFGLEVNSFLTHLQLALQTQPQALPPLPRLGEQEALSFQGLAGKSQQGVWEPVVPFISLI